MNHPNVVPTFGATTEIAEFCVVAPWMPEGELLEYLGKYPGANRAEIVRPVLSTLAIILSLMPKMFGVAEGLSYLHHNDIVHGDLNGVSRID